MKEAGAAEGRAAREAKRSLPTMASSQREEAILEDDGGERPPGRDRQRHASPSLRGAYCVFFFRGTVFDWPAALVTVTESALASTSPLRVLPVVALVEVPLALRLPLP